MSHEIDRIYVARISIAGTCVLLQVIHHFFRDLFTNMGPRIENLVVSLSVSDDTTCIKFGNFLNLLVSSIENLRLIIRSDEVISRKGKPAIRAPAKAHTIHVVQKIDSVTSSEQLIAIRNYLC